MPPTRRGRPTTSSSPTSPPETEHKAPAHPPWLEHPTLNGLRDRLQLVYDCWTLLELPDGTSRRPVSSDIRFWSSGDTKTGPPNGLLMGA